MGGRTRREGRPRGLPRIPQILQLREAEQCGSLLGRPEGAGDSTEPSPVSGGRPLRLAPRSLSLPPPHLPPSSPPAEARAPATLPPKPLPPTSGEQETRGLAEGRQVGEARQGEGVTLDSSAPVHLTAASGTSGALRVGSPLRI